MDKILKEIGNIISSTDSIKERKRILMELQNHIDVLLKTTNQLEDKEIFKNYLNSYKPSENEDEYTLENKCFVNRDLQEVFVTLLNKMDIDGYGMYEGNIPENLKDEYRKSFDCGGYENDTFYIRPYNWSGMDYCDCNCGLDDKLEEDDVSSYDVGFHAKNCERWDINFYYKPTNLKIEWYKYALRGAYSNQNLNETIIRLVLQDCMDSVLVSN